MIKEHRHKYINISNIKKLAKPYNRRISQEFLTLLDSFVESKVRSCCETHNGGKKTLDSAVAGYNGIK